MRFLPLIGIALALVILPMPAAAVGWFAGECSVGKMAWGSISSIWGDPTLIGCVIKLILVAYTKMIFFFTSQIFIFCTWIYGWVLDFSTRGSMLSSITFIDQAWTILRDIINSLFVFVVLAIAFKQLFNAGGKSSPTKDLVHILIAALLINFSLLGTRIAIDASNFITRAVYFKIQTTNPTTNEVTYGPGPALAKSLDLVSTLSDNGHEISLIMMAFMYAASSAFLLFALLLFACTAVVFVIRYFILIILMMTSPLVVGGWALNMGPIKDLAKKWKDALQAQLVFPVVYMLMIYLTVKFARSNAFNIPNDGSVSFASVFSDPSSTTNQKNGGLVLLINYGVITGFMIYSVKLAYDVSGYAKSLGADFTSMIQGKALSMVSGAGRSTLGRAGSAVQKSKWANQLATSDSRFTRFAGDKIVRGGGKMANSTWDARSTSVGAGMLGAAGIKATKPDQKSFAQNGKTMKQRYGEFRQAGINQGFVEAKTPEEIKKQAEAVKAHLAAYAGDPANMLKRAQAEMGSSFYTAKETKELRKMVMEATVEKHKDNPQKILDAFAAFNKNGVASKEFKEERQKVIEQLRDENKKDPKTTMTALETAFGDDFTRGKDKDLAEVRNALEKEVAGAQAKNIAKGLGDHTTKINDIKKQVAELNSQPASQLRNIQLEKLKDDLKTAEGAETEDLRLLRENLSKMRAEQITEFEASSIEAIKGQLEVGHINALNKFMANGGYIDTDADIINRAMEDVLLNGREEVANAVANNAMKYDSGFDLKINDQKMQDSLYAVAMADEGSRAQSDAKKRVKRMVKAMKDREAALLSTKTVLNSDFLEVTKPGIVAEHYNRMSREKPEDATTLFHYSKAIAANPTIAPSLKGGARDAMAKALRGEASPGGAGGGGGKRRKKKGE